MRVINETGHSGDKDYRVERRCEDPRAEHGAESDGDGVERPEASREHAGILEVAGYEG